jgi:hypothetical protein
MRELKLLKVTIKENLGRASKAINYSSNQTTNRRVKRGIFKNAKIGRNYLILNLKQKQKNVKH